MTRPNRGVVIRSAMRAYLVPFAIALSSLAADAACARPKQLGCLSEPVLAAVKKDFSAVLGAYETCRQELEKRLVLPGLSENGRRAAFASIVAHTWAPYGGSTAKAPIDLAQAKVLDCDNYAVLTGHLMALLAPAEQLQYVGWDHGPVGNHAQIFFEPLDGSTALLLDPTVGLVAAADFERVIGGGAVPADQIFSFFVGSDRAFHDLVRNALVAGKYRPKNLLYFYDDLSAYLAAPSNAADYPTPAGARSRALSREKQKK